MVTLKNKFGEAIREYRHSAGKTIHDITNHMSWSKPYLMDIETGRTNPPSKEKIELLAKFLNADLYQLLELAIKEREKVTLIIPNKSETHTQLAALLYKSWDDMTEDQLKKIKCVIKGENY